MLCSTLCLLSLAAVPASREPAVEVTVQEQGNVYVVDGVFTVPCSHQIAWDVLTDYGHLTRFVPVVKRSDPLRHEGHRLLLRQDGVQHVLGFTHEFHLLLDVFEEPRHTVSFRNLDGRDFAFYSGTWKARPLGDGMEIRYHLRMRPRGDPPDLFVKPIVHDNVVTALSALRGEMERRATATGRGDGERRPR